MGQVITCTNCGHAIRLSLDGWRHTDNLDVPHLIGKILFQGWVSCFVMTGKMEHWGMQATPPAILPDGAAR